MKNAFSIQCWNQGILTTGNLSYRVLKGSSKDLAWIMQTVDVKISSELVATVLIPRNSSFPSPETIPEQQPVFVQMNTYLAANGNQRFLRLPVRSAVAHYMRCRFRWVLPLISLFHLVSPEILTR